MRTAWSIAILVCGCWTSAPPSSPNEPVVTSTPPPTIRATPTDRFDQSTPRNAIDSFVRAVELDRYDVVMRFVPNAYRTILTEDKLRAQLATPDTREAFEHLKQNIGERIIENGDKAKMQYGNRDIELVLEDGTWRIKDLD